MNYFVRANEIFYIFALSNEPEKWFFGAKINK